MFVERSSRHQETHTKIALNLVIPLTITSWNFSEPGFWILTKGVISQPIILGWPYPNFVVGIEQPKAHWYLYSILFLNT